MISVALASLAPHASAHLMVAQHGTLNFKDDGAFMVLSLPVSAFENSDDGFDDDKDGKMSAKEFIKYKPDIVAAINNKVKLSDKEGSKPLQGLLISPVVAHGTPKAASEQLVIMGRFALDKTNTKDNKELTFHVGLFGQHSTEKTLTITATRKPNTSTKAVKHKIVLTPQHPENQLFTE